MEFLQQDRTLIMGALNVTPDSFSDGGLYFSKGSATRRAEEMIEEGVDIIDVGGESTRPGADPVPKDEEERRVLPVLQEISTRFNIPVSIDTYKADIARKALSFGAKIVNDISGLTFDPEMVNVVADSDAYVVIMHIKGTPKNMQKNPHYDDLIKELVVFFQQQIDYAVKNGVQEKKIILDPGIGFGKRLNDNFAIINSLDRIANLGFPVLVGPSRKSFIGLTLNLPPEERVEGTAAAVTASILKGAKIIRVHDIKEMKRVSIIADAIKREGAIT
ncbi:MAG: dihydropteroate synthase [Candidatus Marinimicrobia bacterium]|nr:dihydropteroate synthase [Candidatus Neomarinimicrobiota bacterium]MBL7046756.1 dihydropteroate synthase [Candidatus Neomarinimicrobiota bacterium]